jgi:hypothetical protein
MREILPKLMPGIPGMPGLDGNEPCKMPRCPGGLHRPMNPIRSPLGALIPDVHHHWVDEGRGEDYPPRMPMGEFGDERRGCM